MEYKAQYEAYLAQASKALDAACGQFLPETSEVCRAARYSLLGGGKRIRAVPSSLISLPTSLPQ